MRNLFKKKLYNIHAVPVYFVFYLLLFPKFRESNTHFTLKMDSGVRESHVRDSFIGLRLHAHRDSSICRQA